MNTSVMFSSAKDDWRTPPELFAQLNAEFGFTTDAACTPHNGLCAYQIYDSLETDWSDDGDYSRARVFVNPPYSKGLQKRFIAKAYEEASRGALVVMLLPARTDTKAFHRYVLPFAGINSGSHDLAWLAGIIDGEGCIGLYSGGNGDGKSHYLRLTVVNTDQPMLERAKAITGTGTIRVSRLTADKQRRQTWIWECNSGNAARVLSSVYPFLVTKQRQAQMALEFYHGPRLDWDCQQVVAAAMSDAKRNVSRPGVRVEVRFLPGRIKFVGATHGAPFPSMIIIFRGA